MNMQSHENSGAIQYCGEEMTSVLLMRQPASGSFLQYVWGFYSASTAQPLCQPFSFPGVT